jgi:hypothetical protein
MVAEVVGHLMFAYLEEVSSAVVHGRGNDATKMIAARIVFFHVPYYNLTSVI